jgi:GDP-4-dehydro-6-deoxy-D-mannose reductase
MKQRVLITGGNGFVARHLISRLEKEARYELFITTRSKANVNSLLDDSQVYEMNFNDLDNIKKVIKEVSPAAIIHLAAQSNVSLSWRDPYGTFQTNTLGSIGLLNAIEEVNPRIKTLIIGSSDEYGMTAKEKEILSESDVCRPQNPYSISKNALSQYVEQVIKKGESSIIYFRPFNHFGPGQSKGFVVSDFCSQIAEIEAGLKEPVIKVGDLSTYRDLIPVSDVVEAYSLTLSNGIESGIYNVSSGESILIEDILKKLVDISSIEIKIEKDPLKYRPSEVKRFAGNNTKFKKVTGWNPQLKIDQSLKETLDWWRQKTNGGIS